MARKSRGTTRKAKVEITPKDYRFPGESGLYIMGVAGITIVFVWVFIMFLVFKKTAAGLPNWQWAYLFAWPIGAVLLANFLSTRKRAAQIKKAGMAARILPKTHPDLSAKIQEYCKILGLKKNPNVYVLPSEAPFIYAVPGKPGAVITSQPVLSRLATDEVAALIARELCSIRAGNVRLELAISWVRNANPLVKILCLPVFLLALFTGGWIDIVEYTADRGAVLLTGSEGRLNLALVKLMIAQDPMADVNQQDLEAYMGGSADISTDSAQLERHFKIGNFISEQRNFKERIEQIGEYRKSPQGAQAFAKMAELRGAAGSQTTG